MNKQMLHAILDKMIEEAERRDMDLDIVDVQIRTTSVDVDENVTCQTLSTELITDVNNVTAIEEMKHNVITWHNDVCVYDVTTDIRVDAQ